MNFETSVVGRRVAVVEDFLSRQLPYIDEDYMCLGVFTESA